MTGTACILEDAPAGPCTDGSGLEDPGDVVVSPDGNDVYVTGIASSTVVHLARDAATGSLAQRECFEDADEGGLVQEDGEPVARCAKAPAISFPTGLAITPDGRDLLKVGAYSGALSRYGRDPSTGALSFGGCIQDDDEEGGPLRVAACGAGRALMGAKAVTVSPDGRNA